jgi:nitrate/nitrite transporter NarK
VLGVVVIFYLKDRIRDADWLSEDEKRLLESQIAQEQSEKIEVSLGQMFADGKVWLSAIIYFCFVIGLYGVSFWLPTIIKTTGVTDPLNIGLLTAIPYAVAAVAMIMIGRSADQHRERRWLLSNRVKRRNRGGVACHILTRAPEDRIVCKHG